MRTQTTFPAVFSTFFATTPRTRPHALLVCTVGLTLLSGLTGCGGSNGPIGRVAAPNQVSATTHGAATTGDVSNAAQTISTATGAHGVLNNGDCFQLPLIPDIFNAAETPFSAKSGLTRGTSIPGTNQFSYEGVRLSGQCATAMRALYLGRFAVDIGSTGGNGGAFNYGTRDLSGMTRIINVSSDPQPLDMIVFDHQSSTDPTYGHVGTCAYSLGNRVVALVDSNWVAKETGGVHIVDLKKYNILCYQRPNSAPSEFPAKPRQPDYADVSYRGHFQDTGDFATVSMGEVLGDVGLNKRMEAMQVQSSGRSIRYQVHVQDIGWMPVVADGQLAGTTGQGKRIEAVKVWVDRGSVEYWVYATGKGWMKGANGSQAGTTGEGRLLQAIAIRVKN